MWRRHLPHPVALPVAGAPRRGPSGPSGAGAPPAPGGGARGSPFPCPAETFPCPRRSALPCPVPRAGGRDVARAVFPQPLFSSDRALSAPMATW